MEKHHATLHPKPPTPKPIRLVALDLDGTLLTSRKTITRKTHTALKHALDRGIKIVLATARPPRSVRAYFTALGLDTPTINYNGALIWDEPNRRIIEHIPLDPAVAQKVIAWGRKKFPDLLVSVEILDKWYTDHFSDAPEFMTETGKHFSPDFVGPLEAFLRVPITKLMLLGKPVCIQALELEIGKKFGQLAAHTRSDPHMLQVMNLKTSKARALKKICKTLNIESDQVMAIGDASNDVAMLQWAGLALAPENAWDAAKLAAHALLPSNDHDPVAHALERYLPQ